MRRCTGIALLIVGSLAVIARAGYGIPFTFPTLKLSAGATTVTIVDGTVQDSNPLPGWVGYNGAVGNGWTVSVTGESKPAIGSATGPQMDLLVGAQPTGNGPITTLTISFSDNGFGPSDNDVATSIGGTLKTATVTFKTYQDPAPGNTDFALTNLLTSQGPFGPFTKQGTFGGNASGALSSGAYPFSLTEVVTIKDTAKNDSTTFDASITVLPEPGTLLLLGSGLVGLGYLRFRRRAR